MSLLYVVKPQTFYLHQGILELNEFGKQPFNYICLYIKEAKLKGCCLRYTNIMPL
jgi:hypothetical protein